MKHAVLFVERITACQRVLKGVPPFSSLVVETQIFKNRAEIDAANFLIVSGNEYSEQARKRLQVAFEINRRFEPRQKKVIHCLVKRKSFVILESRREAKKVFESLVKKIKHTIRNELTIPTDFFVQLLALADFSLFNQLRFHLVWSSSGAFQSESEKSNSILL